MAPTRTLSSVTLLLVCSTLAVVTLSSTNSVSALTIKDGYIHLNVPRKTPFSALLRPGPGPSAKYCPYCDSSVYSYCSDKLLHDACCCLDPYESSLPKECRYADCSFLHANTCHEHSLITSCCCSNLVKK